MRKIVFALMLVVLTAQLHAQSTAATSALAFGGVDKLLDRVESINLFYGGALFARRSEVPDDYHLPWKRDFGIEFGFHLGDYGELSPKRKATVKDSATKILTQAAFIALARKDTGQARAKAEAKASETPFKVSGITIKKHIEVHATKDSIFADTNALGERARTFLYMRKDSLLIGLDSEVVGAYVTPPHDKRWEFDLGVGYGQLDGITASAPSEFHGYVRELPSVSLYATYRFTTWVGAYAGARTGVISLQDAQVFARKDTTTSLITLSATTFEVGAPFGVDFALPSDIHAIAEVAYMRRSFNSTSPNPTTNLAAYPHTLDLSGWSFDVGFQFPLPKPAK